MLLLAASKRSRNPAPSPGRRARGPVECARAAYWMTCTLSKSGDLVEEPAAARVHEHGVALQFQQLRAPLTFSCSSSCAAGVCRERSVPRLSGERSRMTAMYSLRAAQGSLRNSPALALESGASSSRSQSSASRKRRAPALIPAAMAAAVAAAIAPPAADAMRTAPGAVLVNLHFVRRRMRLQKLAVIGEPGQVVASM